MTGLREALIEFHRVGAYVKVSAVDPDTLIEVAIVGDPALYNQYGVILVSAKKCPEVKTDAAKAFITWLLGPEGQMAIAGYKVGGEQLFFPNAK